MVQRHRSNAAHVTDLIGLVPPSGSFGRDPHLVGRKSSSIYFAEVCRHLLRRTSDLVHTRTTPAAK
jgi:hypothetical protein